MATASKRNTTKENIEVRNNKKNAGSVLERNVKQKSRTTSSSVKKTGKSTNAASKTLNKKSDPAKINITHQRKIQDVTEYRDKMAFETGITLIVIGIIAIFLYVSFLGLGGIVGKIFGGLCFGIFGWVAWFIPLGMLLAYIFTIVNKGDKRVPRKMTGIIGTFVCLAAITDIFTKKEVITEYYTSNHVMHPGYFDCMNLTLEDVLEGGKTSGGLIGRIVSSLLSKVCGNVGACILLFALLILCLFIFEGIELMAALRKRNAYRQEMEKLYGEVRDEIGYSEPSYNVLKNRSSINPFGNSNVKADETDIREKYKRPGEVLQENSGRPDYVESVRRNSNSVMQSVDLKMMGKFLDEQKENNARINENNNVVEKTVPKTNIGSEKKSKVKNGNSVKKTSASNGKSVSKADNISTPDTGLKSKNIEITSETKQEDSKSLEPIPIFREEMNQKFGRKRGKAVYDVPNGVVQNERKVQGNDNIEEKRVPEEDNYESEIAVGNAADQEIKENTDTTDDKSIENDTKTEIYGADIDDEQAKEDSVNTNYSENTVDTSGQYDDDAAIEDIISDDDMYYDDIEDNDIIAEYKEQGYSDIGEYNDSTFDTGYETVQQKTADIPQSDEISDMIDDTDIETGAYQPDTENTATSAIGEVSYKRPENPNRHGKFGGDDYVSASESFNALNEAKIAEPVIERAYAFPPVELLGEPVHNNDSLSDAELRETANKLQETLKSFNVDVQMGAVTCGPTVTRYELLPEQGVRVNKITNLTDDIKLSLAAQSIRIEAPIPGKSAVGIEVPNPTPSSVFFRELLEGEAFEKAKSPLTFAVGKDISGKLILTDIGKMPHLLIAGATGSGKSVCINTLIMSILYKSDPKDVKLIMIDPKVVELSVYNGIPHLMCPVVTDAKEAAATLNWAVREMSDRYNKFTELGVRNIAGYNDKIQKVDNPEKAGYTKMPYIVVIVDEFADLMMVASKDVEDAVCRLAQLARAAGIHLVLATQRPSVNVITGTIKANIPSRIAFSVSSAIDSRTILDRGGAEKLLGKGDMLFFPSGYSEPVRVQGAFVTDEEVSKVVDFLKDNNDRPEYNDNVTQVVDEDTKESEKDSKPDRDEYFEEAGRFVIDSDRAAAGQLQRRFSIGFNRAGRIIDQLHKAGVVGPAEGTKPRKILMSRNEFEMMLGNAPEPVSAEEIDAITEEFGQQ